MESWDLVDETGHFLRTARADSALKKDEYHFAVEIWPVNGKGEILVQKRSEFCKVLPGVWGLTTGRVQAGETTVQGAVRELREELGLCTSPESLIFLKRIVRKDGTQLIWDVFSMKTDVDISDLLLQREEVEEVRWLPPEEMILMAEKGILYCYPEFYEMLKKAAGSVKEKAIKKVNQKKKCY